MPRANGSKRRRTRGRRQNLVLVDTPKFTVGDNVEADMGDGARWPAVVVEVIDHHPNYRCSCEDQPNACPGPWYVLTSHVEFEAAGRSDGWADGAHRFVFAEHELSPET